MEKSLSKAVRKFLDLSEYPLQTPVQGKYIVYLRSVGEVGIAMIGGEDFAKRGGELYHDDVRRAVERELGEAVACVGGGKVRHIENGAWSLEGESSVFGGDSDRHATAAAFGERFPTYSFVAG